MIDTILMIAGVLGIAALVLIIALILAVFWLWFGGAIQRDKRERYDDD